MAFEDEAGIRLLELYGILYGEYGPQNWWPADTAFEMMVGAILTQNTAWSNVEKAFSNFPSGVHAKEIATMPLEVLVERIRPAGFFNQKADRLKTLAVWFLDHNPEVNRGSSCDSERHILDIIKKRQGETLRKELLALKGVGPETADSILLYALDKPYFVVDAYTKRILKRLGYKVPANYDDLRGELEARLPRDLMLYNEFHALIVNHAKKFCRSKPACSGCPLEHGCGKFM